MKPYFISLGAGLLVGVVYGLLHVRSPAPPIIALVGLLGILIGEQLVPLTTHLAAGRAPDLAWMKAQLPHAFGRLPSAPAQGRGPPPLPTGNLREPDEHA